MKDAPRILSLVWNLIRGGTEGQCARINIELARQGLPVRVAVFRREGFFLEAVAAACGPVYHVDIHRLVSRATRTQVAHLAEFIRRERIDIVHAWDADAAIFGSSAARAAGARLITSRRDLGEIYPWYKIAMMNRSDRRARAVVVNARAIEERLRTEGRLDAEKVVLLPNVLDVDEFDRLAAQQLPAKVTLPAGRWIGMVTRLDPEKDGLLFIRAAAQVAANRPDVRFVIAGDGPDRPAMERAAAELGVRERVHFLGDITFVPALCHRLQVGVLVPRANEGLSNTILEYMAAGLPVVATDCGGNKELVADGRNGFITRVGDVEGIAKRIGDLLDDPLRAAAMGRLGRQLAESRHRPEVVARQYLDLYQHVAD